MFNSNLFLSNLDRYVVQIGGWLRNTYAIYALPINNQIQKSNIKRSGEWTYIINLNY